MIEFTGIQLSASCQKKTNGCTNILGCNRELEMPWRTASVGICVPELRLRGEGVIIWGCPWHVGRLVWENIGAFCACNVNVAIFFMYSVKTLDTPDRANTYPLFNVCDLQPQLCNYYVSTPSRRSVRHFALSSPRVLVIRLEPFLDVHKSVIGKWASLKPLGADFIKKDRRIFV